MVNGVVENVVFSSVNETVDLVHVKAEPFRKGIKPIWHAAWSGVEMQEFPPSLRRDDGALADHTLPLGCVGLCQLGDP